MSLTSTAAHLLVVLAGILPANILLAGDAPPPPATRLPNQVSRVSSLATESCIATAGNPALACGATGDFEVGQPIFVPLAAAPNALNAGNGAGVGPAISAINYLRLPGGAGARSGSSTYCYAVTTFDSNLAESAPGPTRCTGATEPARLGGDQSEQPVWPVVAGATQYGIYGCAGSSCSPHQIGTQPAAAVPGWEDFGLPASARTAPGSALNGVLYANVVAIVPNVSMTVSVAPSVSGPVTIGHESCGAINAALSSYSNSSPPGGTAFIPAGNYRCAKMLDIVNQTGVAGHCAFSEYPNGSVNPNYDYGTSLVWGGPDGVVTAREWTGVAEHSDCINYNANAFDLTSDAPAAITQMVVDADTLGAAKSGNNDARIYGGAFYNGYVAIRVGGNVTIAGELPQTDVSTNLFQDILIFSRSPNFAIIEESQNGGFQNQFDHITTNGGIQGYTTENAAAGIVIDHSNFNCVGGAGTAINLDSGVPTIIRGVDIEGRCAETLATAATSSSNSANGTTQAILEGDQFNGPIKLDAAGLVISIGSTGNLHGAVWQPDSMGSTVLNLGDANPWIPSANGGSVISLKSIAQDLTLALNPNRVELDPSLDTVGQFGAAIDFMPWQAADGWPFRIADEYTTQGHQLAIIPAARALADWQPNHSYNGATITPKVDKANGLYLFSESGSCTSGTLATEPEWPLSLHRTVTDNTCAWTNQGQIFPAGAGNGLVLSNTGLYQDGGAVKHGVVTTGAISPSSTATVTLKWTTAFPDTSYTPDCSVIDPGGNLTLVDINGWNAGSLTAAVKNNDSGSRHTGTLACHAFHN